jgi:O-methyltransferase involved in polyketide biosynthesis
MDTRPWRLPLPPNVDWFEVDRPDVLAAKVKTLTRAGVQLRGRVQDTVRWGGVWRVFGWHGV